MPSHTPSPSMSSPLNFPRSRSSYMMDEEKNRNNNAEVTPKSYNHQFGGSIYRSLSWMLGFKEKYSLINCFVSGGALVGFCLARSLTMNPGRTPGAMPAGEWFWLSHAPYKANLFIHIYSAIFGGIGAVFQFIPAIRRRKVILHRLNGYGVLTCLIVGNICGAIVARRSFGGELNVQSGYITMALLIVFSGVMGIVYVKKDTRRHRKWMLRAFSVNDVRGIRWLIMIAGMVAVFAATITGRLATLAAAGIITKIGTYYSVWRCDEVLNLLGAGTKSSYPQCVAAGVNPAQAWVAVHASTHDDPIYYASAFRAVHGMALWIGLLIHVVGVEFYIHKTEAANQVRLAYALEAIDLTEETRTAASY